MSALALLSFITSHFELIELLYETVVTRSVPRAKVIEALKREMTEASDAQMRAELP
jgi:hypothetical protein